MAGAAILSEDTYVVISTNHMQMIKGKFGRPKKVERYALRLRWLNEEVGDYRTSVVFDGEGEAAGQKVLVAENDRHVIQIPLAVQAVDLMANTQDLTPGTSFLADYDPKDLRKFECTTRTWTIFGHNRKVVVHGTWGMDKVVESVAVKKDGSFVGKGDRAWWINVAPCNWAMEGVVYVNTNTYDSIKKFEKGVDIVRRQGTFAGQPLPEEDEVNPGAGGKGSGTYV